MIRLVQEWPYATRQAAQTDIDDGTPGDGALRVPGTIGDRQTSLRIDEGPTLAQYVSQEAWLLGRLAKAQAALDEIAPTPRNGRDVWERIRDLQAEQEDLDRKLSRAECGCTARHCPQHGAPDAPDPSWGPGDPAYDAIPESFPGVEGGAFMPGVRGLA